YGYSCKFLHDRGGYKEWDEAEKRWKMKLAHGLEEVGDDEAVRDDEDDDSFL
ncbi:hypothetical protein KI387_019621, partial [Taxus chinensis]